MKGIIKFFLFYCFFLTGLAKGSEFYGSICEKMNMEPRVQAEFLEKVEQRKYELIQNYSLSKNQGEKLKRNKKKAKKKSDVKNYELLIKLLKHPNLCKTSNFSIIRTVYDLDFALKTVGSRSQIYELLISAKAILKSHKIFKKYKLKNLPENLYDPVRKVIFEKEELKVLIEKGVDISLFEPAPEGAFWENKNIPNIDVKDNYLNNQKIYSGIKIAFPTKGVFKKIRKTQTKPKIDFIGLVDGVEREYKLKVGAEIHSEITAGALSSSLGFYTDITKFVRKFKIYLNEDYGIKEFKVDWYSYFKSYEYEKYVLEEGISVDGVEYIVFREGLLETKPIEINRVGAWPWGANDHKAYRETRGMSVFNMWIANNDIKESGNNKFVLKNNSDDNLPKSFKYQHDLGFSFGYFYREKPNDFLWKIVKSNSADYMEFYYRSFQDNTGFEHMTYWDAKWMVRKIAQLTRKQIEKSVELGGWPKLAGRLIVEKLISRRNDLVENFRLKNDYELLKFDKNINEGPLVNGVLTQTNFVDSTQDYKSEIYEIIDPAIEKLRSLAIKGAISGVKHFDKLVLEGEDLKIRPDILAEVQISIDRKITNNPEITSKEDRFLVHDFVKIRYGVGVGKVLRGKVNYVKNYELVYPVNSKKEGEFHNGFIFNALLPRDIRQGVLPEKYVLIVEDGIEGEGEVLLDIPNFPIDFSYSRALGKLSRTIVTKTMDDYTVYRDVSPYTAIAKSIYADLLLFKIPLWHSPGIEGLLGRRVFHVDLGTNTGPKEKALDVLLETGNLHEIEAFTSVLNIDSNFVTKKDETDFFDIYKSGNFRRTDDMKISEGKNKTKNKYQLKIEHYAQWSFLGDGEMQSNGFSFSGIRKGNKIKSPGIYAEFEILDKATTTVEFKSYLDFVDEMTISKDFLSFSPELHGLNENWGYLKAKVSVFYNKKIMKKILSMNFDNFGTLLSKQTQLPISYWKKRRTYRFGNSINRTPIKYNKLRSRLHKFLRVIKDIKNMKNDKVKYTALADALDRIVWMEGNKFDVLFFKVLHTLIGSDNLIIKAGVSMPGSVENTLPMKIQLFNVKNKEKFRKNKIIDFEYKDGTEIWENFMLKKSPSY